MFCQRAWIYNDILSLCSWQCCKLLKKKELRLLAIPILSTSPDPDKCIISNYVLKYCHKFNPCLEFFFFLQSYLALIFHPFITSSLWKSTLQPSSQTLWQSPFSSVLIGSCHGNCYFGKWSEFQLSVSLREELQQERCENLCKILAIEPGALQFHEMVVKMENMLSVPISDIPFHVVLLCYIISIQNSLIGIFPNYHLKVCCLY